MENRTVLSLEDVKKIELDILDEFHKFCEKNDMKYYLAYGTLLGAIRHKGFIPWDDDIDVVMPRPDYERFVSLTAEKGITENYETTLYKQTKKKSIYPFAKVIDINSVVYEHGKSKKDISGVWIDIFPLDGYPDDKKTGVCLFEKNMSLRHMQDIITTSPFSKQQSLLKKIVKSCIRVFLKMYGLKNILDKMNETVQTCSYESSKLCSDILWGESSIAVFEKEKLEPYELADFEGKKFRIPACWKDFLELNYGDYMQLPPEDQRIPHGFEAYKLQ